MKISHTCKSRSCHYCKQTCLKQGVTNRYQRLPTYYNHGIKLISRHRLVSYTSTCLVRHWTHCGGFRLGGRGRRNLANMFYVAFVTISSKFREDTMYGGFSFIL